MIQSLLLSFATTLGYGQALTADIPEQRMCSQPGPPTGKLPNHPAWQIGHLANTAAVLGMMIGVERDLPESWGELFGRGSEPVDDPGRYPSKAELLEAWQRQHTRVAAALASLDPATLAQPTPHEGLAKRFPTIADAALFIAATHEGMHCGQLVVWRRAVGLGPVM